MTDNVDSRRRSELMAGIRGKNTAPELAVRRTAHGMGLRFRLHRRDLPGRPDLVFPKHRLTVFVHGCFWHHHAGCRFAHVPKTKTTYWTEKFAANVARDRRNDEALKLLGWRVLVIWECETKETEGIRKRLQEAVYGSCGPDQIEVQPSRMQGRIRREPVNLSAHASCRPDAVGAAAEPTCPQPRFVDVYAGCGGLSLGLKRAGWRGVFAIEKDPWSFKTLTTNFPDCDGPLAFAWPNAIERKPWDIRDLLRQKDRTLSDLSGTVDLLAGGPPCQGFSYAGRRKLDDPRNKLFEAYLALVGILRPRFVLLENVRGFTSDFSVSGQAKFKNFSEALQRALRNDYDTTAKVIRAHHFGVPQKRPRFFLVGARKSLGLSDKIAIFFQDLEARTIGFLADRGLPRQPTAKDAISDLEAVRNGTVPSVETRGFESISYNGPRTQYQRVLRDGHIGPPPDLRLARHRPEIRDRFEAIIKVSHEEGRLNTTVSPEVRKAYGLKKMAIRVLDPLASAPTITSLPDDLLHYSEPRILTVRENARLQSFPDWFRFQGKYTTGGDRRRSEVPRYTQVANAVPPLLAEQFGLLLLEIDQNSRVRMGHT